VPVVALHSRLLDLRNCYGKAYSVSSRCCITDRSESRLNCTNFRKTKFEHRYNLHSVFVRSLLSYGSLRHRFHCCSCNSIVTPSVSAISPPIESNVLTPGREHSKTLILNLHAFAVLEVTYQSNGKLTFWDFIGQ
jgi:hypothetical protein